MTKRQVKGRVLPVKGPSSEVILEKLEDYQAIVGGYVEAIELADGSSMYANEEGRIIQLPTNYFAGDVAGLGGRVDLLMQGICGDVVVVGPVDREGYDTDLTEKAKRWIRRVERER